MKHYSIENVSSHFSLSIEIGRSMADYIFEAFEQELMLQSVNKRVQPYAFNYAFGAAYKLAMHDVQTADPRVDDEYVRAECMDEPVSQVIGLTLKKSLLFDSMMPGFAAQNVKTNFRLSLGKSPDAKSIKGSETPEMSVKSIKDL